MKYRADIDGLRAIAVMMVVFYHIGFKFLSGGFIGVDIFFVISGYLITSVIYQEISIGKFSFSNFYLRRMKRILPVFFFVGFVTLLVGGLILLPTDLISLSKAFIAASFFISNIFIWRQSAGYFASDTKEMPLLHTWSLSLEEQFYFIWPVILILFIKFTSRKKIAQIIFCITIFSFLLAEWASRTHPGPSYFLLPTRAGELMIGAFVAILNIHKNHNAGLSKFQTNIIAVLSLALILLPAAIITESTVFPGINSLIPCVGSAALIYVGSTNNFISTKLLSTPRLVFIGKISYSVYLWHWPFVAYLNYLQYDISFSTGLWILFFTFTLSFISWKYVETPARKLKTNFLSATKWIFAGPTLCLLLFFLIIQSTHGVPERYSNRDVKILSYLNDSKHLTEKGNCFLTTTSDNVKFFDRETCLKILNNKQNKILIGDSHAAHLWSGLHSAYEGINLLQATASGCKPVLNAIGEKRCTDLFKYLYGDFLKHNVKNINSIIISARWEDNDIKPLITTISYLKSLGYNVTVLGPIVEYTTDLPKLIVLSDVWKKNFTDSRRIIMNIMSTDEKLKNLSKQSGFTYISTLNTICSNAKTCAVEDQYGIPLQFDYGHLTAAGATYVGYKWKEAKYNL